MTERITVCGKQIKLDDQHLADAVSEEAAQVIAICINRSGPFYTTKEEDLFLKKLFK
jgi:hypothetical protein